MRLLHLAVHTLTPWHDEKKKRKLEVSGQPTTVVSFGFNNLSVIVKLLMHASASALI